MTTAQLKLSGITSRGDAVQFRHRTRDGSSKSNGVGNAKMNLILVHDDDE